MSDSGAKVLLLCAGYGTRMGGVSASLPKPLLPVGGRPLLDYLLEQIAGLEAISEIHLVSNDLCFKAFFEWQRDWRSRLRQKNRGLTVHNNGSTRDSNRLGSVGDLAYLVSRAGPAQRFLVAGCDNLFLFSIQPMWRAFLQSSSRNYLASVRERVPSQLRNTGVLELDRENRILRVHEKPNRPPSTWTAPALYCLHQRVLEQVKEYVSQGNPSDGLGSFIDFNLEREPFYAFKFEGRRLHIGSPEAYRKADLELSEIRTTPGGPEPSRKR